MLNNDLTLFILGNSVAGLAGNFAATRSLPAVTMPLAGAVLAVVLAIAGAKLIAV